MKKTTFNWVFEITKDEEGEFLVISLNGGINVMIDITHEGFLYNLSNKLNEILYHEHVIGTKTNIVGLDVIQEAIEKANSK